MTERNYYKNWTNIHKHITLQVIKITYNNTRQDSAIQDIVKHYSIGLPFVKSYSFWQRQLCALWRIFVRSNSKDFYLISAPSQFRHTLACNIYSITAMQVPNSYFHTPIPNNFTFKTITPYFIPLGVHFTKNVDIFNSLFLTLH